jgi:hypothetical protein
MMFKGIAGGVNEGGVKGETFDADRLPPTTCGADGGRGMTPLIILPETNVSGAGWTRRDLLQRSSVLLLVIHTDITWTVKGTVFCYVKPYSLSKVH